MSLEDTARAVAATIDRYFKHVSIITHKGRVVAIGTNKLKTHPKAKERNYRFDNLHSELDAYMRVPYSLRGKKLKLNNFRFNGQGDVKNSKPCTLCMPWCETVFSSIEYTT